MDIITLTLAKKYTDGRVDILFDQFDETESYEQAEVVVYNKKIYQFTAPKTAGAWDPTKVEAIDMSELSERIQEAVSGKVDKSGAGSFSVGMDASGAYIETT